MKRRGFLALPVIALAGCGGMGGGSSEALMGQLTGKTGSGATRMGSMDDMQASMTLMQEMMSSPDLPAWHEQREKMALAIGDRTFNRSFDRVFDSMTVALATMGARVHNMERVSGYITGSIPDLGPVKTAALQKEASRQYAVAKGFKPSAADTDIGGMSNMMTRHTAGLTLSMVRQSKTQTKVKLRFDNVYYPVQVSEYYKLVWAAVDKQMFLDQSLD